MVEGIGWRVVVEGIDTDRLLWVGCYRASCELIERVVNVMMSLFDECDLSMCV